MVIRAKHGHWSYLYFVFLCLTLIWGNFSLIFPLISSSISSIPFFLSLWYSSLVLRVYYNFCCSPHEVRWLIHRLLSYHIMMFCYWKLYTQPSSHTVVNGAEKFLSPSGQIVTTVLQLPLVYSCMLGLLSQSCAAPHSTGIW